MSSSSSVDDRPVTPRCYNMKELPEATSERTRLRELVSRSHFSDLGREEKMLLETSLAKHLVHGLAYTVGSALGYDPPTREECLAAFVIPNKVGLTTGARAWSKHGHRSQGTPGPRSGNACGGVQSRGWWGTPSGPVAEINEKALTLFWKVMDNATWRNLHWLPHQVLVYEVRVEEGYGMRWSQDWSSAMGQAGSVLDSLQQRRTTTTSPAWVFRGFVEPMIDNGHQAGWRH